MVGYPNLKPFITLTFYLELKDSLGKPSVVQFIWLLAFC